MSYNSVISLLNKGISRPTLYQVICGRVGASANQQLEFMVRNVSIPEMSSVTLNANGHYAQGVVTQHPAHMVFAQPLSMTIICDRDYIVYKSIKSWFSTTATNANPPQGGGGAQKAAYYDALKSSLAIVKLENEGKGRQMVPWRVIFNNAYPVRIGELELGSDRVDDYMFFTVDFYYETYTFSGA